MPAQSRDLAKEVAAFATSNDGVILLGVANDGGVVGLPSAATLSEQDGWIRRIEGVCASVKPLVTPKVKFADLDGKWVLVVSVSRGLAPFYSANNVPYLRHLTSSRPAEPSEVVDLVLSRSGVAAEASSNAVGQAERFADAEQAIQSLRSSMFTAASGSLVSGPKLVVYVIPFASFERPELRLSEVKAARSYFPPSFAASSQERTTVQQWLSCSPPQRPRSGLNLESKWSTRLVRPGHLEFVINIGERIDDDLDIRVDGRMVELDLVSAVDRAAEIVKLVNLSGAALVSAALEGAVDVDIVRSRPGGRRIQENSVWLGSLVLPSLEKPSGHALRSLMDNLWLAGGWDDGSLSFSGDDWTGYRG